MKALRIALPLLIALLIAATAAAHAAYPSPGKTFEEAGEVSLSTGEAEVEGSLLGAFENDHYYMLTGLTSGMRVKIEATLIGGESTYLTVSLYSSKRARLTGYDGPVPAGGKKKITLEYELAYDPLEPEPTLYLRFGKSRGAFNYTAKISVEYADDLNSMRDAGAEANTALQSPKLTPESPANWSGHLSSKDSGNDYADCYAIKADLSRGEELAIKIEPSDQLRVKANLLSSDLFPLRSNSCKSRGQTIVLRLTGDWEPKTYTFYLAISNFDGAGGGGEYAVKAWIRKLENASIPQQTVTTIQGEVEESAVKLGILVGAAALIAISIAILILRRRRMYRVEEVGWWGSGETW